MSSSTTAQNVAMYCGAMAGLVTLWLVIAGFGGNNALYFGAALLTLAVSVSCFRWYAASLRRERRERA